MIEALRPSVILLFQSSQSREASVLLGDDLSVLDIEWASSNGWMPTPVGIGSRSTDITTAPADAARVSGRMPPREHDCRMWRMPSGA